MKNLVNDLVAIAGGSDAAKSIRMTSFPWMKAISKISNSWKNFNTVVPG
jgi:hypothetical protein